MSLTFYYHQRGLTYVHCCQPFATLAGFLCKKNYLTLFCELRILNGIYRLGSLVSTMQVYSLNISRSKSKHVGRALAQFTFVCAGVFSGCVIPNVNSPPFFSHCINTAGQMQMIQDAKVQKFLTAGHFLKGKKYRQQAESVSAHTVILT